MLYGYYLEKLHVNHFWELKDEFSKSYLFITFSVFLICFYHSFSDVNDFKELLNAASGRMKKRSLFDERTEKASASQYFQVRKMITA